MGGSVGEVVGLNESPVTEESALEWMHFRAPSEENSVAGGDAVPRERLFRTILSDIHADVARPRSVVISGMPGSGVSYVLDRLAQGSQAREVTRLSGSRLGATEPYFALEPLLSHEPGADAHPATVIAMVRTKLALGQGAPLLIVDDADLVDEDSLAVLAMLARAGEAQFVLGSQRKRQPAVLRELMKTGILVSHTLRTLSEEERAQILESRFSEPISPATKALLSTQGAETPLILNALIDHAIAEGSIALARGAWVPTGRPLTELRQRAEIFDAWGSRLTDEEKGLLTQAVRENGLSGAELRKLNLEETAEGLVAMGLLRNGRRGEDRLFPQSREMIQHIAPMAPLSPGRERLTRAHLLAQRGSWLLAREMLSAEAQLHAEGQWLLMICNWQSGEVGTLPQQLRELLAGLEKRWQAGEATILDLVWYRFLGICILSERREVLDGQVAQVLAEIEELSEAAAGSPLTQSTEALLATASRAVINRRVGHYEALAELGVPDPADNDRPMSDEEHARRYVAERVIREFRRVGMTVCGLDPRTDAPQFSNRREGTWQAPVEEECLWARLEALCVSGQWASAHRELHRVRTDGPARQATRGGITDLVSAGLFALRGDLKRAGVLLLGARAQLERVDPAGLLPLIIHLSEELGQPTEGEPLPPVTQGTEEHENALAIFIACACLMVAPAEYRFRAFSALATLLDTPRMRGIRSTVLLLSYQSQMEAEGAVPDPSGLLRSLGDGAAVGIVAPARRMATAILTNDMPALRAVAGAFLDEGWADLARMLLEVSEQGAPSLGAEQIRHRLHGFGLTAREQEVVMLAATGGSAREIGESLEISTRTVETHLLRGYRKVRVSSRDELRLALGLPEHTESPESSASTN